MATNINSRNIIIPQQIFKYLEHVIIARLFLRKKFSTKSLSLNIFNMKTFQFMVYRFCIIYSHHMSQNGHIILMCIKTVIVYVVHLLGEISMDLLTNELGHKYLESRGLTRAEK